MILHSYVEQVMTMCRVQKSDEISCLHNMNALWYIIIILYSDDKKVLMMCPVQDGRMTVLMDLVFILHSPPPKKKKKKKNPGFWIL